jgi:hypothetical protein
MKPLIKSGILLALPLIPACSPEPLPPTPPSAQEQLQAHIEAAVREQMKDPDSTKFKGMVVVPEAGCGFGQVLSKNSYGGYGGYQGFAWTKGVIVYAETDRSEFIDAMGKCSDEILPAAKARTSG